TGSCGGAAFRRVRTAEHAGMARTRRRETARESGRMWGERASGTGEREGPVRERGWAEVGGREKARAAPSFLRRARRAGVPTIRELLSWGRGRPRARGRWGRCAEGEVLAEPASVALPRERRRFASECPHESSKNRGIRRWHGHCSPARQAAEVGVGLPTPGDATEVT